MGKRKKKKPTKEAGEAVDDTEQALKDAPKSMIFRRGKVGVNVINLIQDMRKAFGPHTAENLKESKKNAMKDFTSVAPQLGVTHFMCFNQNERGIKLRVIRTPQGPTLTFNVLKYSLMRDIANGQKKPHSPGLEMKHAPLLVLNNFSGKEEEKQLMTAMFQHMLPAIDVKTVKLADARRVVLLNMDPKTKEIELRHYIVNASPVGLTKSIKRIIKGKMPNLGGREDIADYVTNPGALSDSEAEDTPENRVVLSQNFQGRGNKSSHKSAIRLKEVGPRLTLQLLKIEQELCGGQVLYHALKSRSPEEMKAMKAEKQRKKMEKLERKKTQERNIENKKRKRAAEGSDDDVEEPEVGDLQESDDDSKWYREEVGEAPDSGMFERSRNSKDRSRGDKSEKKSDGGNRKSRPDDGKKKRKVSFAKKN